MPSWTASSTTPIASSCAASPCAGSRLRRAPWLDPTTTTMERSAQSTGSATPADIDPASCSKRHRQNSLYTIRLVLLPLVWQERWRGLLRWVAMAQHFLLSAAARSLSAAKVMRMSDGEVVDVFLRLRWPETDGKPICPGCGCTICYACPRSADRPRWRCKACRGDFSITSCIAPGFLDNR